MFLTLLMLFTVVPFVELYLLIVIGARIGAFTTIIIVILTGILGAALARNQGFRVLRELQVTTAQGQMPGKEMIHGALVLVGGLLLLTPGFLTDLLGFSLLTPFTRNFYVQKITDYFRRRMQPPSISVDYREL